MKNKRVIVFIIAIMLILIIISICWIYKKQKQYAAYKQLTDIKEHYKTTLDSIPRDITPIQAAERGYFVYDSVQNKIYNKDVLDRFVKNTEMNAENRIADEIIIVLYTINGEPIIYDLGYKYKENIGYVLAKDATRVDGTNAEFTYIPREYYEVVINHDIPSEHYGITVTEDFGISAGIITLTSYSEGYEDIEFARYLLNIEVVDTKIDPDEVTYST